MITNNNNSYSELENSSLTRNEYVSESKKIEKQKCVNGVLKFLKENGIEYKESAVTNIVVINDKIHLSLQYNRNSAGYSLYKFRFTGSNKWYTSSRYKFVENIKSGKYN